MAPRLRNRRGSYSLAMLFKETLEQFKPAKNITLQVFATDLDQQAIEKAREACSQPTSPPMFGKATGALLR